MSFILVADIRAIPGQEDALRRALQGLVAPTLAEKGCQQYDLHQVEGDPGHLMFYEIWTTKADWEAHNVSPHVKAHHAVSKSMTASADLIFLTRIAG